MADSAGAKTIELSIVSPARELYSGRVLHVQIPMHDGLMGVLPGHAPLVGMLGFGLLTLNERAGRRSFVIDGGFVEVTPRRVTVLAGSGEALEDVDLAAAQKAFEEASHMIANGEEEVEERLEKLAAARTRIRHAGGGARTSH